MNGLTILALQIKSRMNQAVAEREELSKRPTDNEKERLNKVNKEIESLNTQLCLIGIKFPH
jgi:predicted nuclease with TOPRIM domain